MYKIRYKITSELKNDPGMENGCRYFYLYSLYIQDSIVPWLPMFTRWRLHKTGLTEEQLADIMKNIYGDETIVESRFLEP